jgi:hypothetical protein
MSAASKRSKHIAVHRLRNRRHSAQLLRQLLHLGCKFAGAAAREGLCSSAANAAAAAAVPTQRHTEPAADCLRGCREIDMMRKALALLSVSTWQLLSDRGRFSMCNHTMDQPMKHYRLQRSNATGQTPKP